MGKEREATRWLLLVYQFAQGPGSLRVKVWRRLQSLGAVAIKNSVYVLPHNEQCLEDFQWLLTELRGGSGEGAVLESRFLDGMTDREVQGLFDAARNADYTEVVKEIRPHLAPLPRDTRRREQARLDARQALARARRRLDEVEAIDFFGAASRESAEAAIRALAERTEVTVSQRGEDTMQKSRIVDLKNRVWVTRRNVRVDRIASAWLIRRWIDPDATFKFVPSNAHTPAAGEVRFDMFEGEFTHQGDACTFEVLAGLAAPKDVALHRVAEVVHDIDLKDGKYGRAEAQGIANLITGLVASVEDDPSRIERGGAIFEDLYQFFKAARA